MNEPTKLLFVEYVRPAGRRVPRLIPAADETLALAADLVAAGATFTYEHLGTGLTEVCVMSPGCEEELAGELVPTASVLDLTPWFRDTVVDLVEAAHRKYCGVAR